MAKIKELPNVAKSHLPAVINGKVKKSKLKGKKKLKSKKVIVAPVPAEDVVILPPKRMSDDPAPKQLKWTNRQRVLVFAARGINHRHRHLMEDIKKLMPHHKTESKMERSKNLYVVNEMCEMKNCNKCLMFEGRKMRDLYLWASNIPNGPSAKFLIENIYTMGELKMTGNCLRGSRPLLSFDPKFSKDPHFTVLKELLTQIFGVPNHHPKSQPFFDHVYTFMILDNRIWFRNYQILSEDGALAEIGPRFVLNPVKIFSGSFGGTTLWENPSYISPARFRQSISKKAAHKYQNRIEKKAVYEATRPETGYPDMQGSDLFKGDAIEKAKEVLKQEIKQESDSEQTDQENEDDNGSDESAEPPAPFSMKLKKEEPSRIVANSAKSKRIHTKTKPVSAKSDHILKKKPDFAKSHISNGKTDSDKSKPDMAIRRKQLKAKSKAISDQIKKRKQKGGKKLKKK